MATLADQYERTIPAFDAVQPQRWVTLTLYIDYRSGEVVCRTSGGRVFYRDRIDPAILVQMRHLKQRQQFRAHVMRACAGHRRRQERRRR